MSWTSCSPPTRKPAKPGRFRGSHGGSSGSSANEPCKRFELVEQFRSLHIQRHIVNGIGSQEQVGLNPLNQIASVLRRVTAVYPAFIYLYSHTHTHILTESDATISP